MEERRHYLELFLERKRHVLEKLFKIETERGKEQRECMVRQRDNPMHQAAFWPKASARRSYDENVSNRLRTKWITGMSSNTAAGREFQLRARDALAKLLNVDFELDVGLAIGSPRKMHSFDLAAADRHYVGEAKAYTWTASGNVPSAQITGLREAVQYLQSLPPETRKFIVMKRSQHPRNGEPLADYFSRLNGHLLGTVAILELADDDTPRIVQGTL